METVRALIDRDIVQPVEGVYRLTGEVGELAVPDSLHALLAARLDALDPPLRRLVADAAVLGTTFPAEALVAVSGQDEPCGAGRRWPDLVRREVLTVSADPLSPERGSFQFAQQMLRQVAYDTLSRRDRKGRHLTVAAHLRTAFPGDGEEVIDVIASHYLDALRRRIRRSRHRQRSEARPSAALIRAAERAERTGAPARAAPSYATAAELSQQGAQAGTPRTDSKMLAGCGNVPRKPPSPTPAMPRRSRTRAGPATITCSAASPGPLPGLRPSPDVRCACGVGTPRRAISSPPPSRY